MHLVIYLYVIRPDFEAKRHTYIALILHLHTSQVAQLVCVQVRKPSGKLGGRLDDVIGLLDA